MKWINKTKENIKETLRSWSKKYCGCFLVKCKKEKPEKVENK
ncbi:MAG: hypothetical protein QMD82_03715 [bacterium]|nr:hypothetical protein [bacterium]